MRLWAIVPVKPFSKGKSRLSDLLSPDQRTLLNSTLLSRTIRTLRMVQEIQQIIVVSRDSSALSIARSFGVKTIQEDAAIDLNKALKRAVAVTRAYTANAILVVPSDLPLLEPSNVTDMLSLSDGETKTQVIIAPDRRKTGTNALYLSPPGVIDFKFGENSFNLHIEEARSKQIKVSVYENANLGLDIDLPQDLEILSKTHQTTLLEELMLDDLFEVPHDAQITREEDCI